MQTLVLLGLVGFGAQLINGSLGMGYGVTSTSALLAAGTAPALAAATVNLSQVGSQLVSGYAHWRFGNVDWDIVRRVALPGAAGAFGGALVLSRLSSAAARPIMSIILMALGGYLLVRFTIWGTPRGQLGRRIRSQVLMPISLVGGFVNSTGGGGSGPIITSALLATGRLTPRMVVGSISAAEFAVVSAGSAGFVAGLGLDGMNLAWVLVMLAGGVPAAPVAAWLTKHLPGRMLGSVIGGLIIVVNLRNLFQGGALVSRGVAAAILAGAILAWICAVAWSARAHVRGVRADSVGVTGPG